jgi:Flp pilus assembly protein TadG
MSAGPRPVSRTSRIDWRDDRGQIGGIEALPFGLLVFVVGLFLVLDAWAVIDTKMAVNAAAREAVHAVVESNTAPAAEDASASAARGVIVSWGRNPADLTVDAPNYRALDGTPTVWRRCAQAAVTVHERVPLVTSP